MNSLSHFGGMLGDRSKDSFFWKGRFRLWSALYTNTRLHVTAVIDK